jgi:tetratricopeptide (TPR) repeat protein
MFRCLTIFLLLSFAYILPASGQANQAQTHPSGVYIRGLELFHKQKYHLAATYFDRYITENARQEAGKNESNLAGAQYYKAVCARKTGQDAAERLLLDFIEQYPGHEEVYAAYYHLGDFYFFQNNYKDAIQYFSQASPSALNKEEKEDFQFKFAFSYFSLKNFREARSRFQTLVQNTNSAYHEEAVYYSGLSAYYLKDYKEAMKLFRKIENSNQYRTTMPYYIASIQFINGEYREMVDYAEPKLTEVRNIRYTNEIKKLLGNAWFELKDYGKAEKYLSESMAALGKVNQEDYYQLGYVQYRAGNYQKAIENLKKLTFLDNEMVQNAMYILGQAYSKTGDKPNAKNAFQQAARMKYNAEITEESLFNIAKLTYDMGNHTEALILLRKFLQDYPNSKFTNETQDILADVFLKTRNYEEAMEAIEKMKSPTESIKTAYQKMAYFRAAEYYSNSLMNQADQFLDRALKYPKDKSIEALTYYFKADIAHIRGDYEASNNWLSRFSAIASSISTDHSSRVSAGTGFYLQAYNSYKRKDFVSAQILFARATERLKNEKDPVIQETIYPDAVLRLADSYYMQKKYKEAIPHYSAIAGSKQRGADYATYQKAMINGIIGNTNEKISGLREVQRNFPNSAYADDALYELGSTYAALNNPADAINAFKTLVQTYPKSEFVPYAYNRVGLLQYNSNKMNDALASYKFVIQKYPQTPASQEALLAIKDIYITMGDPQGYFDLLKQFPGAMISTSSQDSIVYQSAEAQFIKGDYTKALSGFDSYIKSYPSGAFILPARYYRAECYNLTNQPNAAIADYEFIIAQPTNRFTERSLLRASSIRYQQGEYNKAAMFYEALGEVAKTDDNQREAIVGAMRSYYKLGNYNKALEAITKVLSSQGMSETVMIEATFYRGVSHFKSGNSSAAIADFESTIKRIDNAWAAESKYHLALIAFQKKDFKNAEKLCFEFISTYPSYAQWLIKTYILLSDVYLEQGMFFQAKATLQSILDNYDERDDLYKEAESKYQKVLALESGNSGVKSTPGAGFSEFEK